MPKLQLKKGGIFSFYSKEVRIFGVFSYFRVFDVSSFLNLAFFH